MDIKQKSKVGQFFCKHTYIKAKEVKKGPFICISGERIYTVCENCGKVKGSVFLEFEGMGYK